MNKDHLNAEELLEGVAIRWLIVTDPLGYETIRERNDEDEDGEAGDLIADAFRHADLIAAAPRLAREHISLTQENERLREALAQLFDPIEHDASLNLQGASDDLSGRFNPNDKGVCVRTINRAVAQLEIARTALGNKQ